MIIFVDVDDTIVRTFGTKRIPIPKVIEAIRQLKNQGETLYCWSRGGAEYARSTAVEFGIDDCFVGYLPKPDVMIDDQSIQEWRHLKQIHPAQVQNLWADLSSSNDLS